MRIFALVILSMLATVASADPWLCIEEAASGFLFKNGKWTQGPFHIDGKKFILRKPNIDDLDYGKSQYGVYALGSPASSYQCAEANQFGEFRCHSLLGEFKFAVRSGRYLRTYTAGYWDGEDVAKNTPIIARGRCSIM